MNRWLDDMAIQQGVNRVSCQVTIFVVVTDIDVSSTVIMNTAGGNIVARCKSEGPKCSGIVSSFITQISTVTKYVLHGEP